MAIYLDANASASERNPFLPRINVSAALALGPFRPGPWRPSAHRTVPVFVGVWEPEVSQPLHRQSPSPPRTRPPPRPTLRCAPGPWSLADSQPPPSKPRTHPPAARLPATKADKVSHARATDAVRPAYPARTAAKGYIHITRGSSGSRRCRCVDCPSEFEYLCSWAQFLPTTPQLPLNPRLMTYGTAAPQSPRH